MGVLHTFEGGGGSLKVVSRNLPVALRVGKQRFLSKILVYLKKLYDLVDNVS